MRITGIKPLVISAPFGNHYRPECATATVGTHTLAKRAGPLRRWWRVIATVRRRGPGAWVNRLGLPSPGVTSLRSQGPLDRLILSVQGFDPVDWDQLIKRSVWFFPAALELNLSCPNAKAPAVGEAVGVARKALAYCSCPVIAKLGPVRPLDFARPLWDVGIRHFHLCNTIPVPQGGLSGKPLKPFSLWAVGDVRQRWGEAVGIIGGGGVASAQDVRDYVDAGADHVAVASALFNPLNWFRLSGWSKVLEE